MSTLVAEFEGLEEGQHLTVEKPVKFENSDKVFFIHLTTDDGEYFAKEDAPAIALAILEAAGYTNAVGENGDITVPNAITSLRNHLRWQESAKEQEALDAEAKALYEAFHPKNSSLEGWPGIATRDAWREVAAKAREIHAKEENK